MKKKSFLFLVTLSAIAISVPLILSAAIVTCTGQDCNFSTITGSFNEIKHILINYIAEPLGLAALVFGAVLMMLSPLNAPLLQLGKNIFVTAIVGLILVFAVDSILGMFF